MNMLTTVSLIKNIEIITVNTGISELCHHHVSYFYLGIDKKINKLTHHNLFDSDIDLHIYEIYSKKIWPTDPLFYVFMSIKN